MNENIISVKIEDEIESDQYYECLIDTTDGTLLEIKSSTRVLREARLPALVKRITKEFKATTSDPQLAGRATRRTARIIKLVIPDGMEEIDPGVVGQFTRITIEHDSPKFRMMGNALIEVRDDCSGKVIKAWGAIPTDSWIAALGSKSLDPDTWQNFRRDYMDDIVIPDNITTLEDGALNLFLTCFRIVLPGTIKEIKGKQSFGYARITFQGTVEHWKAVKKSPDYSDETVAVDCIDGTLYECGDPDNTDAVLEQFGGCIVNTGTRCVVAFDNNFNGDIVIPDFVKEINPYGVGAPCNVAMLGGGRNIILHPHLEYISAGVIRAFDEKFKIIMDEPGVNYYVSNNMLIEKRPYSGKVICGWFGKDSKADRPIFSIKENAVLNVSGADIYIPEGIRYIYSGALRPGYCGSIHLPQSLIELIGTPFRFAEMENIFYAGTVQDWKKVKKERFWSGRDARGKVVVCSDGEVPAEDYNPRDDSDC